MNPTDEARLDWGEDGPDENDVLADNEQLAAENARLRVEIRNLREELDSVRRAYDDHPGLGSRW